jgi:glucose/mannose-6-phosphate isomerase
MPPRASVAYLFFPMVGILQKLQLINANDECEAVLSTLHNLSAKIVPEVPVQNNVAKQLAHKLYNKFVVVYGQSYYSAIAKRFRTQLNENPKILARDDEFPEMCHNDLSGWSGELYETTAKIATVLIRDKAEHPQIRKRIEFAKSLFADKGSTVIEIWAPDSDYVLPKMMYVMYICDFISVYLSILRGVDPTPVEIIERLKEAIK